MADVELNNTPVFNEAEFTRRLQAEPQNLLLLIKDTIKTGQEAIRQAFFDGADTLETVNTRAHFIDQVLIHLHHHFFADCGQVITLVAVGGYGRSELHPASDIDIMLLLDETENDVTRQKLEQFLMLLWDSRLEVGHSVRTLDECIDEARNDITVITNLMESRYLCGDQALFDRMIEATGPDRMWDSKAFFQGKLDEQIQRHRKFGETAYNLEPNIKENPGGLRDLQMIGWVAKRHFGTRILRELVSHQFLTQPEFESLQECQIYLWKIRIHLHYLTGKHEDRLLFDMQRQLAHEFGYEDGDNNLAIEQFMQKYYRTVLELERLNELLLQLFRQKILYADQQNEPQEINKRFLVINDYIAAASEDIFRETPSSLLEIFLIMELHPEIRGVQAQTIRWIRQNVHLIDDSFRASQTVKQLFIDIIKQPRGVTHELRRMNRYGILAAYIPAFAKIVGRMQYDLFHAYTVDQHTLYVVRNMRRLSVPDFGHEHPLASGIFHHLRKPKLLYLAGLFHDIAKGRGGNHADLGAVDAREFCLSHELNEEDSELVAWLVQKHLLMSLVAQRKDISDPEVIYAFANEMGDLEHLDYLYLLTMCDIRATNPKQWNSWKDNLLSELYHKTASAIKSGLNSPVQRHIVAQEHRTSAMRMLAKQGVVSEVLNELWSTISDDYFIYHTPDEVSWHSQILLERDLQKPIVDARINQRGETEIFIYTTERQHLFYTIASTLEQLGLSIADAKINISRDNYALNSYRVLEEDGSSPTEQYRTTEIVDKLQASLQEEGAIPRVTTGYRRKSRTHSMFSVETEIRFDQLVGKDLTVMFIETGDRPGLLADIAQVFAENGIHLEHAKIATAGERAIDSFHISDSQHNPLLDDTVLEKLRDSLLEKLRS